MSRIGSLLPVFGVRVPYVCSYYLLIRSRLLSGHLLGKGWSLGGPYILFVFWLIVILVISSFGFESAIWVLIAPVPGHCILVTFRLIEMRKCFPRLTIIIIKIEQNEFKV